MTENLAGRGEGLAGLAEAIKLAISAGADLRYDEYGVMEMPIGHLATKWDIAQAELQRILAALEAAAPPSTGQAQFNKEEIDVLVQGFSGDTGWLTAQLNKLIQVKRTDRPSRTSVSSGDAVMSARALATPSTQAPHDWHGHTPDGMWHGCVEHPEQSNTFSTTSAREQSSATAAGNLSATETVGLTKLFAALEKWRNTIFVDTNPSEPSHADLTMVERELRAEWESYRSAAADNAQQPKAANPTPSHSSLNQCPNCGFYWDDVPAATQEQPAGSAPIESFTNSMPVITVTGGAPPNCSPPIWKQPGILSVGSPRKVGEEGAGDALWQRCLSLVERCREKTPDKWDFAHELAELCKEYAALARSSSVPVGEQKQEEGV